MMEVKTDERTKGRRTPDQSIVMFAKALHLDRCCSFDEIVHIRVSFISISPLNMLMGSRLDLSPRFMKKTTASRYGLAFVIV